MSHPNSDGANIMTDKPATEGLAAGLAELLPEVEDALFGCAQLLDSIALEWAKEGTWSEWDQSIRDKVGRLLFAAAGITPPEGQKYGVAATIAAAPSPASSGETGRGTVKMPIQPSDAMLLSLMAALHSNVPEVDRPASRSDFSDEQWGRVKSAYDALLVQSLEDVLATPEQKPEMVTVKALVWGKIMEDRSDPNWPDIQCDAPSIVGQYHIEWMPPHDEWRIFCNTQMLDPVKGDMTVAKAAAQADYATRILSAIKVTP